MRTFLTKWYGCITSLCLGALLLSSTATAGAQGPVSPSTYYAQSHALLIGINRYPKLPADKQLQFAVNDVQALKKILVRSYGFAPSEVKTLTNEEATKANIERALADLTDTKRVHPGDRILIYFSGHGQTVKLNTGKIMGFLAPSDAEINLDDEANVAPYLATCLKMDTLWDYLESSPAKHALIIADACYSGLLTQKRALSVQKLTPEVIKDLAGKRAMQVITAGDQGQPTLENASWGHGAFTFKLLEELSAKAASPGQVFAAQQLAQSLTGSVSSLTQGKQTPQYGEYKTDGQFFFISTAPQSGVPVGKARISVSTNPPGAKVFIDNAEQKGVVTPADVEIDLGGMKSKKVEVATELQGYKQSINAITVEPGKEAILPPIVLKRAAAGSKIGETKFNPKDNARMVYIPAGPFLMGTTDEQIDAVLKSDARQRREWFVSALPQHRVSMSGYWIYEAPVIVAMFRKFCNEKPYMYNWDAGKPAWGWLDDHPMVMVNWNDAKAYCEWAGMSLPSEAQFEKAARGPNGFDFPWGNNYDDTKCATSALNKRTGTVPVRSYPANGYGLYDMAGNVWQWCEDLYDANYYKNAQAHNPVNSTSGQFRVLRGNCWGATGPSNCRTSYRIAYDPVTRNYWSGFRCAVQE